MPNSELRITTSELGIPNLRRNHEFRIPTSECRIRNSEFRPPNSECRIRNSEFADLEFRIRNPDFRIRNTEFRNLDFGIRRLGEFHKVRRIGIRNSDFRIQNAEFAQLAEVRILNSKLRIPPNSESAFEFRIPRNSPRIPRNSHNSPNSDFRLRIR